MKLNKSSVETYTLSEEDIISAIADKYGIATSKMSTCKFECLPITESYSIGLYDSDVRVTGYNFKLFIEYK